MSIHKNLQNSFPRVLPAFPVITSEKVSGSKYCKVVKEYRWEPIHITDLKEIKQAIAACGLHSSFVREIVKMWTFSSKAKSQDWAQLISAVIESGPQLLWRYFFERGSKNFRSTRKSKRTLRFP